MQLPTQFKHLSCLCLPLMHCWATDYWKTTHIFDGEVIEVVNSFCYYGDVVSAKGGEERTVTARTAAGWNTWGEMAGLLTNQNVPLKKHL